MHFKNTIYIFLYNKKLKSPNYEIDTEDNMLYKQNKLKIRNFVQRPLIDPNI